MSEHRHDQPIPLGALLGAGALMLCTIGLAAGARHARLAEPATVVAPRESIAVRFEDRPGGTIAVLDAATGREVSIVPERSNGFVRGVLRGMFRTRKLESIDRGAEFRLAREADGRLTLVDPESGRKVDLDSFGPTNSAAFASILVAGGQSR